MQSARFEQFSPLHLATVLGFALLWLLLIAIARQLGAGAAGVAWRKAIAGIVLAGWVLANGVQMHPAYFEADVVLPLQVCDLVGLLAAWVLYRPGGLGATLVHFWGLGFSMQAVLTPDIDAGPGSIGFWTFWVPHANLLGAACWSLAVDGYRPRWRDAVTAFGWSLVYLALMLPFDLLTGFNYGYVGPGKPVTPSLLDVLGPWPWRLLSMAAMTATVFALLAAPWALRARPAPAGAGPVRDE
jgi:hypothetical integral membrane protein (TIGR02206 family)